MPPVGLLLILVLTSPPAVEVEPGHAQNTLYRELLGDGLDLGGTRIRFPAPRLQDGQTAASQTAALSELAGGERAATELLRDSVTAPFVLKVRDEATAGGDPIRVADLVFAVHADLAAIDPAKSARDASGRVSEVANMRVETTLLTPSAVRDAKIPPAKEGQEEWYAHLSARLLDRIQVEATDHVVVSKTADSLVVAARTDRRFGLDGAYPNLWKPLARGGRPVEGAKASAYPGGASYVKISRFTGSPGTLLVEAHFAFLEPRPWFDGAPILRSKFAPIAQDQIRRLRREIQSARPR